LQAHYTLYHTKHSNAVALANISGYEMFNLEIFKIDEMTFDVTQGHWIAQFDRAHATSC